MVLSDRDNFYIDIVLDSVKWHSWMMKANKAKYMESKYGRIFIMMI